MSLREGRAARDLAMEVVDEHAPDFWKDKARAAILFLAEREDEFTTDDVWELLDRYYPQAGLERRALGPLMLAAAKDNIIERTEQTRFSNRRVAHANPKRVWRSVIR